MAAPTQDQFPACKDGSAFEPACTMRMQRRGWPQSAIADVLLMTLRSVQESVTQSVRDERLAVNGTASEPT